MSSVRTGDAFRLAWQGHPVQPSKSLGLIFERFLEIHWNRLWAVAAKREVQINKLGRNALFVPIFGWIQNSFGPADYIEVGASVGIGMLWPFIRFDYGTEGRVSVAQEIGSTASLKCTVNGGFPVQLADQPAAPASLIGIDTEPLDWSSKEDARWLQALTAPGDCEGRSALQTGLSLCELARPIVLKGCALDLLPTLLADQGRKRPVVIYHSMTLHHLKEQGKLLGWRNLLRRLSSNHLLFDVGVEAVFSGDGQILRVEIQVDKWKGSEVTPWLKGSTDRAADGTEVSLRLCRA